MKFELYQIAYDERSLEIVRSSGFRMLDNMGRERPDWYEYWPIRRFLSAGTLEDDVWYGFVSPRFGEKTGLGPRQVEEIVASHCGPGGSPDVVLFSPQPDMGALFLNVFEQGELFHPGFLKIAQAVVEALGFDVPLAGLVTDARQIVYSNYFVARKPFWEAWFRLTEAIFAMAEDPAHPLGQALSAATSYPGQAQQKIFMIERVASLMLATQPHWQPASANSFQFAWSGFEAFHRDRDLAVISDALKVAYRAHPWPEYIKAFENIRARIGPA
jgi:hypothetical protein